MDLFSHASAPAITKGAQASDTRTPVYVSVELPLEELWLAFTEYTHLWWPASFKKSEGSYLEFGEKYFLEDEDDGTQHILAETEYFQPCDVIALRAMPRELGGAFESRLSFVFDEEGGESLVDICSGIIKPRDLAEDAELGVLEKDLDVAQEILGAFARFVQSDLTVEAE